MRRYEEAGCAVADVLLPRADIDIQKWAVVACDQFTSQPEYWQAVEDFVGEAPSTLRLIFPEVFLGEPDKDQRIRAIRESMSRYLDERVLEPREGLVYLERETGDGLRRGLVLALDLEQYDYSKGSSSLVRATEGTIVDRLPPRIAIREGAPLELPHIMVLIDDPEGTVIEPLAARKHELRPLYELDLMMGSGHLTGWCVEEREIEEATIGAIAALGQREVFERRYGLEGQGRPVLLYAMGDGNHSLATAKAIWEATKAKATDLEAVMNSPTRYALVELVNVHDESLVFEPIHRVLFDIAADRDPVAEMAASFRGAFELEEVSSLEAMTGVVDVVEPGLHRFGVVTAKGFAVATVTAPKANLAVGTLQEFLDGFMAEKGARELDYVHDTEPVATLGSRPGNVGFYLPGMSKQALFESVILDGALPRKTFSM